MRNHRMRKNNVFKIIGIILLFNTINNKVYSHDIPLSEIYIVTDNKELHLELFINLFDLNLFPEVDQDHNGVIEYEEFDSERVRINDQIISSLSIIVDGITVQANSMGSMIDKQHHLIFRAHYPVKQSFKSLRLISNIDEITVKSQITQVTFGKGENQQKAQMQGGLNTANFTSNANYQPGKTLFGILLVSSNIIKIGFGLISLGIIYYVIRQYLATIHWMR